MARYPEATWRPLPENSTAKVIKPRLLILHTAVDSKAASSLYPYFERGTDLESTFWLPWDGRFEQYMDTERQADANYKANPIAMSVETEDDGDPSIPWSDKQVNAIVELCRWAHQTHGIPLEKAKTWDGSGLGYHSQFPDKWTPYKGKTCPGPVRIKQFNEVILPALAGEPLKPPPPTPIPPEDDVITLYTAHNAIWVCQPGVSGPKHVPSPDAVTAIKGLAADGVKVVELQGDKSWYHDILTKP